MIILDWITNAIAKAVQRGVQKGLEQSGFDPEDESDEGLLTSIKAHVIAPAPPTKAISKGKDKTRTQDSAA